MFHTLFINKFPFESPTNAINIHPQMVAVRCSGMFHMRHTIRPLTALVLMSEMTLLPVIWAYQLVNYSVFTKSLPNTNLAQEN